MTPKIYVFVGSLPCHMMGVFSTKQFGQWLDLDDQQARDAVKGGCAIVPAPEFDAIGFTEDELQKYGPFGSHATAPAEFQEKKKRAVAAYEKFRESVTEEVA